MPIDKDLHNPNRAEIEQPGSYNISEERPKLEEDRKYLCLNSELTSVLDEQHRTRSHRQFLYRAVEVRRKHESEIVDHGEYCECDHQFSSVVLDQLFLRLVLGVSVEDKGVLSLENGGEDEEVHAWENKIFLEAHQFIISIKAGLLCRGKVQVYTDVSYIK